MTSSFLSLDSLWDVTTSPHYRSPVLQKKSENWGSLLTPDITQILIDIYYKPKVDSGKPDQPALEDLEIDPRQY